MTPEERQEIREAHHSLGEGWDRCVIDEQSWPCDTARLLADYDHLVERERAVAREMLRREEAVTRSITVPKADYDHLVEVARALLTVLDDKYPEGEDDEQFIQAAAALRALIDPATPDLKPAITVATVEELREAVATAPKGTRILVANGTYDLRPYQPLPATPEPVEGEPHA